MDLTAHVTDALHLWGGVMSPLFSFFFLYPAVLFCPLTAVRGYSAVQCRTVLNDLQDPKTVVYGTAMYRTTALINLTVAYGTAAYRTATLIN